MNVKSVMTKSVFCCTPETTLTEVAGMLLEHDCGAIPVVEDLESMKPVGIITDRDIACRCVAKRLDPSTVRAGECMTSRLVTVSEKASLDACCKEMEANQVRRVVVVDQDGRCCGLVSQSDVALHTSDKTAGAVLKRISLPAGASPMPS